MKNSKNEVDDDKLPVGWRIFIIVFVITLLIYLLFKGGNGVGWYPGQPIHAR